MKTTVYLARHGAYENPKKILHLRSPGFPLSPEGHTQAELLADILNDKPIIAAYASPLTRARETAEHVAKRHKLIVATDDRLMDLLSPLYQGKPLDYMQSIHWNFYNRAGIAAGGEYLSDVFRRVHTAITEKVKKHAGGQILVVSHGDPIMSIQAKYRGQKLHTRKIFEPYVELARGFEIVFENLHPVSVTAI